MNARIAIIDFLEQDVGIKILFPEADYFILREEFDRSRFHTKYNIDPIVHNKKLVTQIMDVFNYVDSNKYDYLFIIGALYDGLKYYDTTVLHSNTALNHPINDLNNWIYHSINQVVKLIKTNNFKSVCFFDNYDYDYDPNSICNNGEITPEIIKEKRVIFFKRNYNKKMVYANNVYPFPYIIFGHQCNIDMVTDLFYKKTNDIKELRIFFSGCLFGEDKHKTIPECNKKLYGCVRNRREIYDKLNSKIQIYNPGVLPHAEYKKQMGLSKYCLDLLGVGDPNVRTFEILSVGSLRIAQRSNLKWPFDDDFC
jgi:hypothetical protein